VLSKALLYSAVVLVLAKLVFRLKFRELGQRLDRAVTIILVLIVVAYGAHVGYWIFGAN
jgi:hypothetical protein